MAGVFGLRIEELNATNQGEVAELIRVGLTERWGRWDPDANPELDDMIAAYGHGRTILLRSDNGEPAGTGTLLPRTHTTAEIVRISVSRSVRRLGVGRLIAKELVATARRWGADRVILEATSAWADAIEFYRRCGFIITHCGADEFGPQTFFEYRLGAMTEGPGDAVGRAHAPSDEVGREPSFEEPGDPA